MYKKKNKFKKIPPQKAAPSAPGSGCPPETPPLARSNSWRRQTASSASASLQSYGEILLFFLSNNKIRSKKYFCSDYDGFFFAYVSHDSKFFCLKKQNKIFLVFSRSL